jgi:hypothetical protein
MSTSIVQAGPVMRTRLILSAALLVMTSMCAFIASVGATVTAKGVPLGTSSKAACEAIKPWRDSLRTATAFTLSAVNGPSIDLKAAKAQIIDHLTRARQATATAASRLKRAGTVRRRPSTSSAENRARPRWRSREDRRYEQGGHHARRRRWARRHTVSAVGRSPSRAMHLLASAHAGGGGPAHVFIPYTP